MTRAPLRLRPDIEAHPVWPIVCWYYKCGYDLDVAELVGMARSHIKQVDELILNSVAPESVMEEAYFSYV